MFWKIPAASAAALMLLPALLLAQKNTSEMEQDTARANRFYAAAEKFYKETHYDSSIAAYGAAGEIYRKRSVWKPYLNSLDLINVSYRMKAQYAMALAYCDSFAREAAALLGPEDPEVANAYSSTGVVYQVMGAYDRAMDFHFKALNIREKKLGNRHTSTAVSYANLAILYYYKGHYEDALTYNYRALDIRLALQGPRHQSVVSAYINLGVVYRAMADYDKAEEMYQKALDITKQTVGEKHPRVATIYSNFGIVYDLKGDAEKALSYYKKAASIRLETLGPDHPDLANTYNDMGILFSNLGEYDQALYYYDQSFRIREKNFKGNNPFLAMSYNNLGTVFKDKRMYDAALEQLARALTMNRAIYGERHVEVASGYHQIGETYFEKRLYDSADHYFNRAMDILRDIHGEYHPLVAKTYRSMARLEMERGHSDSALSLAQQALISVVPDMQGSPLEAMPLFSDSLSDPDVFDALSCKAEILEKAYLKTQRVEWLEWSLRTYHVISDLIDRMRYGYRAEGSKLLLGKKAKNEYERAIHVCYRLYRLTGALGYAEKGFAFSEKSKSGVLLESMFDADARRFAGIPDSLLAREKELRMSLSSLETRLERESENKAKDAELIRDYENRLFAMKTGYDDFMRSLEKDYPRYFSLKYRPHPVDIAGILGRLGTGATLIEYFVGDSAVFSFTLNAFNFDFRYTPKEASFDSVISGVRRAIVDLDFKLYPKLAHRAYRRLIGPSLPAILQTGRLIVIPDGPLNYLPFDALLTQEVPQGPVDFTKLPYLIRDMTVSYYYTAGFIASDGRLSALSKNLPGGFLGFAPVFPDSDGVGYINETVPDTVVRDVTVQGMRFPELPYTEKEVNSILKEFKRKKRAARIYLKNEAAEAAFKSSSSEPFRFIHIASHGFINEANPKLSGIIFAQGDTSSSEDGVLYAGEIYGLKLDAELVALSACKSGWGKVVKGEGIMGLTRGFIYSGAKNVLVSLWQLGDESASELMIKFYEYVLNGDDLSTALRKAKLDFIRQKKLAYPADWSGFVLIGR